MASGRGIVSQALQGCLIGTTALASRNLNRAPNAFVGSAKAPLGGLCAAYVLNKLDYPFNSVTDSLVKAVVPAISSGLTANSLVGEAESCSAKSAAWVMFAGAAGWIFANRFVRPESGGEVYANS